MKVTIQSVNFTAAEQLREFIQLKLDKLDHYYDHVTDSQVYLKVEKDNEHGNKHIEIKVNVPGHILIATEDAGTFEAATDLCMDKLKHQLIKYKEKTLGRTH